ncbi:hypothetical protein, partial [Aeromonas hydrophila]|uniref:hypothetical protein n=1 Tax=Aeromonas hydrophila TaxID=644 RepID=UPI001965C8FE
SIITSTTRTAPWDTVHHGNFCAVGYHNPKREKVSGPMGSNPVLEVVIHTDRGDAGYTFE